MGVNRLVMVTDNKHRAVTRNLDMAMVSSHSNRQATVVKVMDKPRLAMVNKRRTDNNPTDSTLATANKDMNNINNKDMARHNNPTHNKVDMVDIINRVMLSKGKLPMVVTIPMLNKVDMDRATIMVNLVVMANNQAMDNNRVMANKVIEQEPKPLLRTQEQKWESPINHKTRIPMYKAQFYL